MVLRLAPLAVSTFGEIARSERRVDRSGVTNRRTLERLRDGRPAHSAPAAHAPLRIVRWPSDTAAVPNLPSGAEEHGRAEERRPWADARARTRSRPSDGACRSSQGERDPRTRATSKPCASASRRRQRNGCRWRAGRKTPASCVPLHDLGEGARHAALDRPTRV
jgi:hypothetical protein